MAAEAVQCGEFLSSFLGLQMSGFQSDERTDFYITWWHNWGQKNLQTVKEWDNEETSIVAEGKLFSSPYAHSSGTFLSQSHMYVARGKDIGKCSQPHPWCIYWNMKMHAPSWTLKFASTMAVHFGNTYLMKPTFDIGETVGWTQIQDAAPPKFSISIGC